MVADSRPEASSLLNADETLFWAARHGSTAEVAAALAKGASVRWRHPVDGRTPLAEAVVFDQMGVLEALLAADSDIDAADTATGLSPLGLAVVHGSARCLCHLLRRGASLEWRDHDGWTPLMHAAAHNQLYEAQQLLAHGANLEATVEGVGPRELAAVGGHSAVFSLLDMESHERKRKRDRPSPRAEKVARVVPASPAPAAAAGQPMGAERPQKQPEPLMVPAERMEVAAPSEGVASPVPDRSPLEGVGSGGSQALGASGAALRVDVHSAADIATECAAGIQGAADSARSPVVPSPAAPPPPPAPLEPHLAASSDPRLAAALPVTPPAAAPCAPAASSSAPLSSHPSAAPSAPALPADLQTSRSPPLVPTPAVRLEVQQEGDDIVVRLHHSEIVRLRPSADLVLSATAAGRTQAAMDAINGSLTELLPDDQIAVTLKDGAWLVTDGRSGDAVPFVDGLVIPTARTNPLRHVRTESAEGALPGGGGLGSVGDGGGADGAGMAAAGAVGGRSGGLPGSRPGMSACGGSGCAGGPGAAAGAAGANPVAAVVQHLHLYPPLFHAVSTNLALQSALLRALQAGGMPAAEQVVMAIERGVAAGGLHGAHAALVALLSRQQAAGPAYANTNAAGQPPMVPQAGPPAAGARDGIATDPRRRA
jgi:hypothetical protein